MNLKKPSIQYSNPYIKFLKIEYKKIERNTKRETKYKREDNDTKVEAAASAINTTIENLSVSPPTKNNTRGWIYENGKPLHIQDIVVPKTYSEALKSLLWPCWEAVIATQINNLNSQQVYTLLLKLKGAKVLPRK